MFVLSVFPWGEGALAPTKADPDPGPDTWQIEILELVREKHLSTEEALQIAVASGHGPGKSALIAWIILWFVMTKPECAGIVTANTSKQLTGKTWREVGVWLGRIREPYRRPWVLTATKLYHREYERTWFIAAVEWSEKNPDAFAGLHAKWVLAVMDEGASIPKIICETVMGAMTTPHAIWIMFGNPTKNSGFFFECFHKARHRWITRQVDSRSAKMTNKAQIAKWVEDYGEDSDFVRVRVRGVFPRTGAVQFIGTNLVQAAFDKFVALPQLEPDDKADDAFGALVFGVDVARFGDDASTIWWRRGRYARRLARYEGKDTFQLAGFIGEYIDKLDPDMVFIDGIGVGAGVVDNLNHRGYGTRVYEVTGSKSASDDKKYHNLRAECWGRFRDWLKAGGALEGPEQQTLDDCTGPEYFFDIRERYQLESKDDMKARGMSSPDNADALAITFAQTVAPRDDGRDEDRYKKQGGGGASSWAA